MASKDLTPQREKAAPLIRWPHGGSLGSLQREMNELFDDFVERGRLHPWGADFLPKVDVEDVDGKLRVSAEVAGVEPKDVEVSIDGDVLTIKGEKKSEKETKEGEKLCVERSFGSFRRVINLPSAVDADKAIANFKNGVLHITLPKLPGAEKAKKIKVTA